MPQVVICPSCSAHLEVPEGDATLVQCPQCHATISLAGESAPAAPVAPVVSHPLPQPIVAKGAWDYRWRRFALVVVLFGYGVWSCYDGFYKMPRDNQEFHEKNPGLEKLPHPALDIPFNKALGVALPPLSLAFLIWVLYASRGEYRFDGITLNVPGHPPVNLKAIKKVDRSNWDRKGIGYLHYQAAGSSTLVVMKLDDFVYDRQPTDNIFERVAKDVEAGRTAEAVSAPVSGSTISPN